MLCKSLGLETLENRRTLSANVQLLDNAQLLIEGTDVEERVHITETDGGISVRVSSQLENNVYKFSHDQVNSIRFLGRGGDDVFRNNSQIASIAYGNAGNDSLYGGSGNDRFHGGDGDDALHGGEGDDQLHGDYGNDLLAGGAGHDDLRGWFGDDTLLGGDGDDLLSGYEGNDQLLGEAGNDILKGHEGDDLLIGGAGNDQLFGWTGNDVLLGESGDDYLSGWSGHDVLIGGFGNDQLLGHAGNDLLIGGSGADQLDGGTGQDLVITGSTIYDNNVKGLERVMAIWNTSEDVTLRGQRLLGGTQGIVLSFIRTVRNDGDVDQIFDNRTELDLFLFEAKDVWFDV